MDLILDLDGQGHNLFHMVDYVGVDVKQWLEYS